MKHWLFILALTSLPFINAIAEFRPVWAYEKHYGFYYDTLSFPKDEAAMLAAAENLSAKDLPLDTGCHLIVSARAYFKKATSLAFYRLEEKCGEYTIEYGGPDINRNLVFYNFRNGALYRFGGGIDDFSAVFGDILAAHFDREGILELIGLFLDTRNSFNPYEILWTPQDFVALYDSLYGDIICLDSGPIPDRIRNERKIISPQLDSFKWKENEASFRAKFYAWGGPNSIVYWDFEITRSGIELKEEKTLFSKLGYYSPLR